MVERLGAYHLTLQEAVATERSRDRFTLHDVEESAKLLGFGLDQELAVEYDDDDVSRDFLENAWKHMLKKAYKESSQHVNGINLAFRMLSEARLDVVARKLWSDMSNMMSPEQAYHTLEVPAEVDDYMLVTIFNLRVSGYVRLILS